MGSGGARKKEQKANLIFTEQSVVSVSAFRPSSFRLVACEDFL
jgi:hypothetical protein